VFGWALEGVMGTTSPVVNDRRDILTYIAVCGGHSTITAIVGVKVRCYVWRCGSLIVGSEVRGLGGIGRTRILQSDWHSTFYPKLRTRAI
jgi:hypothetical protein